MRSFFPQADFGFVTFEEVSSYVSLHDSDSDSLERYLMSVFEEVDLVQCVCLTKSDDVHYIWVGLRDRDPAEQEKIYAIEAKLIDQFPELIFDFYVLYLRGRDINELVTVDDGMMFSR